MPPKDLYSFPPNSQATYPPPGQPIPQQNPISSYLPAPAGPINGQSVDSFTGPVNPQFMPPTSVKGNAKEADNSSEMDDLKDPKGNYDDINDMKDGQSDVIIDMPPPPDHEHHPHDDHPEISFDHDHDDHPDIIFDHDHDHHDHHPHFLDHPPSHDDIFSSASGPDHHDHFGSEGVDAFPEVIYDHYPHHHHHPPPPPRKCI